MSATVKTISQDHFIDRSGNEWCITTKATTIEQGTVYTVHFCDLSAEDAETDEGYSETFATAEQATIAVTDFRSSRSTSGGTTMTNIDDLGTYDSLDAAMQVHAEEVGTLDNVDPCPTFYRCHSEMLGTFSAIRYDGPADITRVDDVNIAGGLDDIVPCEATEEQLADAIDNGEWWGSNDATSLDDWMILKLVADAI